MLSHYYEKFMTVLQSDAPSYELLYNYLLEMKAGGISQVQAYDLLRDIITRDEIDNNEVLYDIVLDLLDIVSGYTYQHRKIW